MIILDTNVLSETLKPQPNAKVCRWFEKQASPALFCTTITQAEMFLGAAILAPGRRKQQLQEALAAIFSVNFEGRVLPFDTASTLPFAEIVSNRRSRGLPITHADAQIAAIARSRGATIATRNTTDFEHCGVAVLNPWD